MDLLAQIPLIGPTLAVAVPFILVLAIVVFVHEFGHYIVGRWCGIGADVFSVGFGREIYGWTDSRGTRWRIAALPLGGYVKFSGDADASSASADPDALARMTDAERARSFHHAPLGRRALTVLAGPVANFILSVVIFALMALGQGRPLDAPVIGAIDLGLVGRLTPQMREKTIDLMVAAVQSDYRGLADALFAIGTPTRKIDRSAYEAEVATLADRYLGKQLGDIQVSRLIQDLVGGATKYGLEIPPDFLLVGKALMTVEGVGKEIYPDLDVFEEMKPYFVRLMWARYSPERVMQDLVRTMTRISGAATEFPLQTQEILDDLRKGRLEVRMREPSLQASADVLGRRIYSGLVVTGLLLGSGVLLASESWIFGGLFFLAALGWGALHTMWAMWLGRRKRHR